MAARPWSQSLAAGAVLLVVLQAIAACNSVLSIEPAELDDSTGDQTCGWPVADPTKECAACDELCAANCSSSIDDCLKDQECRKTLAIARKCAGDSCADSESCSGCTAANPLAAKAAKCLSGCHCNVQRATTLCESYCACMDTRCPNTEPGGSKAACIAACSAGLSADQAPLLRGKPDAIIQKAWSAPLPASMTYCFWQHCERGAEVNDGAHCNHAIGESQPSICPPPVNDPNASLCPFGKSYGNGPCNANADCCSGACLSSKVCAP